MWIVLIVVAVLAGLIGLGALATLLWLGSTLQWSNLDDDRIDFSAPQGRKRFGWFGLLKPRNDLLTYRRDALGRFRKYRR